MKRALLSLVASLVLGGAAFAGGGPCGTSTCGPDQMCWHEICADECRPQPPGVRRCDPAGDGSDCPTDELCSQAGFCFLPAWAPECSG